MQALRTGRMAGPTRSSSGVVLMSAEGARFSPCPMIVMQDSATGGRAGPTAKRVGAATTMHGAAKTRRHLSHTIAQLAIPTGRQAGPIQKNSGAACTPIEAVPRPAGCMTAMRGMQTGRLGGQLQRNSGAVGI